MQHLVILAIALLAATSGFSARAEVLIGVAGPMSGKLSWIGEQMQRGAELAVTDTNAAGGVLGEPVRLIVADDFCDPEQAVVAARKLIADRVSMVVGHYCSGASIPASRVYDAAGVVQISPGSTNPQLTDEGHANVFRVIGRDDVQGTVAGNYLADHWSGEKIAILHDGTTYGKGLADETKKQLNKRGLEEAIYRAYAPGKDDYATEVAALQAAGIAVVYVGGYHTEAAVMARTARDHGHPVQLVSGDAMATEEFALLAGAAADDTRFTFVADPRRNAEAASVVEEFRAAKFEPAGYTLLSYAAVQAWAQAVGKAGALAPQAVIASLRDHEFDTVLGRIDFDGKGDLTAQNWIWYIWKGGEYAPAE